MENSDRRRRSADYAEAQNFRREQAIGVRFLYGGQASAYSPVATFHWTDNDQDGLKSGRVPQFGSATFLIVTSAARSVHRSCRSNGDSRGSNGSQCLPAPRGATFLPAGPIA